MITRIDKRNDSGFDICPSGCGMICSICGYRAPFAESMDVVHFNDKHVHLECLARELIFILNDKIKSEIENRYWDEWNRDCLSQMKTLEEMLEEAGFVNFL